MAQTQENPVSDPKYLEFFGLKKAPFARLSTPSQIFCPAHHSILMSHLASATKETDCLVVLRGTAGSGKTTLLNRYLSDLDADTFYATIDDSCDTATDFYATFLRQLGFKDITGSMNELRIITREFLVHRASSGDTVLMVMDNAHLVRAVVLEQLRWLAEARHRGRRVLSVVIAGDSSISRIIESPALQELQFRKSVDFHIRVFSRDEAAQYIHFRLDQAGNANAIKIGDAAQTLIYEFTRGIPSPINKLCNALLREAQEQDTRVIQQEMVRSVAGDLELLPPAIPLHAKGRRKGDRSNERITERESTAGKRKKEKALENGVEVKQFAEALDEIQAELRESEQARSELQKTIAERDERIARLTAELAKLSSS